MSKDKIPEGYFENFGKKLNQSIQNLEDDIESCTEILKFGKEEPYLLPQGYFSTVLGRVKDQLNKQPKQRSLWSYVNVAACVLFIIGTIGILNMQEGFNPETAQTSPLEQEEPMDLLLNEDDEYVEEYLDTFLQDIGDEELNDILESVI